MTILFPLFALFVLFIFNSLTHQFCHKLEMNQKKQSAMFRLINISVLILLVSSYVRVLNVMA